MVHSLLIPIAQARGKRGKTALTLPHRSPWACCQLRPSHACNSFADAIKAGVHVTKRLERGSKLPDHLAHSKTFDNGSRGG